MIGKPVTFMNEGMQIVGILHLPDGKEKSPLVIFNHGWTGNHLESHRILRHACIRLCKGGIAGLRFSRRGHGDSEGDFCDITLTGEISDLKAALDFVCTLPEVDTERIGALGFSHGGTIAICQAAGDPRIKAVLTWSTPSRDPYERYVRHPHAEKLKRGEPYTFTGMTTGVWQLKSSYYEDIMKNKGKYNVLKRIKEISPRPVCFIQGKYGPFESDAYRLFISAKEPKELIIIPGKRDVDMHHWWDLEATASLYEETVNWFMKVFFTPEKIEPVSTKW